MKIGQKIRNLTLIEKKCQKKPYKTTYWLCKCKCGTEKWIADSSIRYGRTISCGCLKMGKRTYYETPMYLEKIKRKITEGINVDKNGCWIWSRSKHKQGYAHIVYGSRLWLGHRVSYEIFKGKIPGNMLVCHKCDVPSCVNPDHLFLGSCKENVHDAVSKGRFKNRKQGKHRRKFTFPQAEEIRELNRKGMLRKDLSKKFGCGITCIERIVNYKTYLKENL